MSTDISSELVAFHAFLGKLLESKDRSLTPEKSVEEFRNYQNQLAQFRRDIQPALEELDRGEGNELDFRQVEKEVLDRLSQEGIAE